MKNEQTIKDEFDVVWKLYQSDANLGMFGGIAAAIAAATLGWVLSDATKDEKSPSQLVSHADDAMNTGVQ